MSFISLPSISDAQTSVLQEECIARKDPSDQSYSRADSLDGIDYELSRAIGGSAWLNFGFMLSMN
jgi:hypothetical protein